MTTNNLISELKNDYQILLQKTAKLAPFVSGNFRIKNQLFDNQIDHKNQTLVADKNLISVSSKPNTENQPQTQPKSQNLYNELENAITEVSITRKNKPLKKQQKNWKLKKVLIGHNGWVRCISFDPSNDFFATGSSDRTIKFWELATGNLIITLTGHVSGIRGVEISKRHPYLFSCSEDKTVRCWDLNTNKSIRSFNGHLSGVYSLSLHPELDLLASAGRDSLVRLWDIRTRQQVHTFEGHTDVINSVAMQADEPQLISGSSDSTVRLWDITAGKSFVTLTNHKKGIRSLKIHPVEYTFVSAARDNTKLWKCPDGQFLRNFENKTNGELINCIAINHGDILASGSDVGYIRLYDWDSGDLFQEIKTINQPGSLEAESSIYDIKFDQSSTRFVSCECDKTIKIWEQEAN